MRRNQKFVFGFLKIRCEFLLACLGLKKLSYFEKFLSSRRRLTWTYISICYYVIKMGPYSLINDHDLSTFIFYKGSIF